MDNYIQAYYDAIQSGQETVGHWVFVWYGMVLDGIREGRFFFSPQRASRMLRFCETMCRHSKGRSDLIRLELWQKAFFSVCFGVIDRSGNRQFREVVLIVGRKNGKTLIAACCGDYMLLADGEVGPEVYTLAPKRDQALICFHAAAAIVRDEPDLEELCDIRSNVITLHDDEGAFLKALPFAGKKSDGFNPHMSIHDEFSSWRGDQGLKQYEVMKSALGARAQPMVLNISTAGYETGGIYDALMDRCMAVLTGRSKETRLAPFLYMIDDVDKWNDLEELRKANPCLGVSISEDYLREEIAAAEISPSKRVEFLTKYCNVRQNSSLAWLESGVIEAAASDAHFAFTDFRGCYCVGGIDLSKTTDLTSCCIVIERGGELYVISQFFMPAERLQAAEEEDGVPYGIYAKQGFLTLSGENHVDYRDCFRWFAALVQQYKLYPLQIGYDKYSAAYLVDDMKQYGFHMDDVYQGFNLTPVIREFEGLIKDGKIHIGDNSLLKIHFYNTALKLDTEKNKVRIEKSGTRTRIDGMAALLDAMCVRQKWFGSIGQQLRNAGK